MSDQKSKILEENALPHGAQLQSQKHTYTIDKALGSGAFGIVYKAWSVVYDGNIPRKNLYAIKEFFYFQKGCFRGDDRATMVAPRTTRDEVADSARDFELEAKRLQQICTLTDSIVRVNEIFRANGTFYYVMEYLDGGDLEAYLNARGGRLDESAAVALIRRIAAAVGVLHSEPHRLLHLDLKPNNIIMKTDLMTSEEYPVLIDFGTVVHLDRSGNATTGSSLKGFTYGYAPLEQIRGTDTFDARLDIYALGAILFFLLTGRDPMPADRITPEWIVRYLPAGLSGATRRAILHAMEMMPQQRTASVEEFIHDLDTPIAIPVPERPQIQVSIADGDDDNDDIQVQVTQAAVMPKAQASSTHSTLPLGAAAPKPITTDRQATVRADIKRPETNGGKGSKTMRIILIVAAVVIGIVAAAVAYNISRREREQQAEQAQQDEIDHRRREAIKEIFGNKNQQTAVTADTVFAE